MTRPYADLLGTIQSVGPIPDGLEVATPAGLPTRATGRAYRGKQRGVA